MKRRKWWFIAFGVVLLVACVAMWNWSERVPYAFMLGAKPSGLWIRTGFGPDTAIKTYLLDEPFDSVVRQAQKEMTALRWRNLNEFQSWRETKSKDVYFSPRSDIDGWLAESVNISPPKEPSRAVTIEISAPATWNDRFRIWFKKTILRDDR